MNDMFDIRGKKAIITGGSSGLGKACVEILNDFRVEVFILDKNPDVAKVAAELTKNETPINYSVVDLSDKEQLKTGFQKAIEKLGTIDILVNNAGLQYREKSEEFPIEKWEEILAVNLTATFLLCQFAAKVMLKKGKGKIINVASLLSFFGGYTVPAYAVSKGGVALLTKALSNEWAKFGICVNAIAPGYMDTPLNAALVGNPEREPEILSRVPIGRWGKPDDIKGAIIFLSSKASDFITGIILPIDGGFLAR